MRGFRVSGFSAGSKAKFILPFFIVLNFEHKFYNLKKINKKNAKFAGNNKIEKKAIKKRILLQNIQ